MVGRCGRKDLDRVGSHVVERFGEVGRQEVQVWKGRLVCDREGYSGRCKHVAGCVKERWHVR